MLFARGAFVGGIPVGRAAEGGLDHGAVVDSIPPGAQDAFVPSCGRGLAVGTFDAADWLIGWFAVWTESVAGAAFGSCSQLNNDPNGKCWTTGYLDRTSALYILIIPYSCIRSGVNLNLRFVRTLLIFPHPERTPEMSKRMGLCSQKGPVLTSSMKPIAEKYILCFLSLSTTLFLAMSPGLGAP